jgi:hypothetical protein
MHLVNDRYRCGPFPLAIQNRWAYRVALAGGAIALVVVALHLANRATLDLRLFDLAAGRSVAGWASALGFALAGLTALAAGLGDRSLRAWPAAAAIMLAFSADDVAMLNERLADLGDRGLALLVIEPLVVLAVLAVFVLVARTVRGIPRALVLGAILALAVAQAASSAGFLLEHAPLALGVLVVLEEGAELLVAALLLRAAVAPLLARANTMLLRQRRLGQSTQGRACLMTRPPSASTLNSTSMANVGSSTAS